MKPTLSASPQPPPETRDAFRMPDAEPPRRGWNWPFIVCGLVMVALILGPIIRLYL